MAKNKQNYFDDGYGDAEAGKARRQEYDNISWQEKAYLAGFDSYDPTIEDHPEFIEQQKETGKSNPIIIDYKPEIVTTGPLPDYGSKNADALNVEKNLDTIDKALPEIGAAFLAKYGSMKKFRGVMQSFAKSPDEYKTAIHHIDQLWMMACAETNEKRKNRLLNKMQKLQAKWE